MRKAATKPRGLMFLTVLASCLAVAASQAWGHCDTLAGPVVKEARIALEKGDITPVLKWVKKENEAELKTAFERTLGVRNKGPEAKELADLYFLETLVRLHRAGEGAPYTGLKDEPIEPIVALTDKSLESGSDRDVIKALSDHLVLAIREKFSTAVETMKTKNTSVEAGREFVEAYVVYTHFVEGIHAAIAGAGGSHHEASAETSGPRK